MANWNDGYVTDIEYLDTYFSYLNPLFMNLNLTFAGFDVGQHDCISLQTSSDSNDKQSYLEMGFGRGVSLCVHAATTDMSFVGTDFNPSHTLFARNLAKVGNADIQLYDDSFELLYKRLQKQEAEFDYIVLLVYGRG